jgi:hypothetical protein
LLAEPRRTGCPIAVAAGITVSFIDPPQRPITP